MVGVDKIKAVLKLPLSLAKAYEAAKEDGKIDVKDAFLLIEPISNVGDAVVAAKGVKEELKDLSPEERLELEQWVKQEFDIADDDLEAKIEKGLALALHIAEFVGAL